jgi:hypothetical protein
LIDQGNWIKQRLLIVDSIAPNMLKSSAFTDRGTASRSTNPAPAVIKNLFPGSFIYYASRAASLPADTTKFAGVSYARPSARLMTSPDLSSGNSSSDDSPFGNTSARRS